MFLILSVGENKRVSHDVLEHYSLILWKAKLLLGSKDTIFLLEVLLSSLRVTLASYPSIIQVCYPGTEDPSIYEDNAFYGDFNMDEVDLSIENYEELFGMSLNDPEHLFENQGIDGLFETEDMSGANSGCKGANAIEVVLLFHS